MGREGRRVSGGEEGWIVRYRERQHHGERQFPDFLSRHSRYLREEKKKKRHVVEDLSCADNGVYLVVVACVPMITSSLFVLKHTWRFARPVFLSPDSSEEARTAAGLGTPPFLPPLPLLPLLTIEAKSGILLPGFDHVLLGAGNNEAFPAALATTSTLSSAVGSASLLPARRRTWSRLESKTPDFASIVSNGSRGSGGGKGGVPRPAAVRASSLLSGERKTGFAALERQVCLSTNNNEVIIGTHATTLRYTPLSAQLRSSTTWLFFFFLVARFAAEV